MGQVTPTMPWDLCKLAGRDAGKDIFVLGTGTSLAGFDYGRLADRVVIALNDAPKLARRVFAYHLWADTNLTKGYRGLHDQDSTIVVCDPRARSELVKGACHFKDRVFQFQKQSQTDNLRGLNELYVQFTVASAGITLAWRLGAARIFLLGVDAYKTAKAYYADGSLHRSGSTRKVAREADGRIVEDRHGRWIQEQRKLRHWFTDKALYLGSWPAGGVYNLSTLSEIDAWEKVDPKEVLG